jgi:hypothetical protein
MVKHPQDIDNKVINRISGHDRGWVFTTAQFSYLESQTVMASPLEKGKII